MDGSRQWREKFLATFFETLDLAMSEFRDSSALSRSHGTHPHPLAFFPFIYFELDFLLDVILPKKFHILFDICGFPTRGCSSPTAFVRKGNAGQANIYCRAIGMVWVPARELTFLTGPCLRSPGGVVR